MRLTGMLAMLMAAFAASVSWADDNVAALTKQAESGSLQEKTRAARILGEIGPSAAPAVSALVKSLDSENAGLRYEAANSLGMINADAKQVVPALGKLLNDKVPLLRFTAIEALRRYGPSAKDSVPQLKEVLNDKEPMLSVCAARAIVEIDGGKGANIEAAQTVLVGALKNERHDVALEGIHGLAVIGSPAVSAIQSLIGGQNVQTSINACDALAAIGTGADKAVDQLTNAAKSNDMSLRWHAISALGDIGPGAKSAAPVLIPGLIDPDPQVRFSSERTLIKLGKSSVPALVESLKNEKLHAAVAAVIAEIGPDASAAVPALAAMLRSKDAELRREAILALAAIGNEANQTIPDLIKILEDSQSPNRPAAAFALGKMAAKNAVPALQKTMQDKDNSVLRLASVWALLQIDPTNDDYAKIAVPQLTTALENENPEIRREAARTLGRLGAKAKSSVPALQKQLADPNPAVRREVLIALAETASDNPALIPEFVKIVKEGEPALCPIACYALGKMGDAAKTAVPTLRQAVKGRDLHEKTVAAWALVQIAPDKETAEAAIPLLVSAVQRAENPEVRAEAAQALGKIGSGSQVAKDALNNAIKDPNEAVAKAADKALKSLK